VTRKNVESIFDDNDYWRGEYHLREKVKMNEDYLKTKPGKKKHIVYNMPKSMEDDAKVT
jgi:hypothetical protein